MSLLVAVRLWKAGWYATVLSIETSHFAAQPTILLCNCLPNDRSCCFASFEACKPLRVNMHTSAPCKHHHDVKDVFHFAVPRVVGVDLLRGIGYLAAIVLMTALVPSQCLADQGERTEPSWWSRKAEGWFWYKDPPNQPTTEEAPTAKEDPSGGRSTGSTARPMSTKWLQEQLPILREQAIDNPTAENLAAYKFAERIMYDKAQAFSDMAAQVTQDEPLLDENLRVPIASAAKAAVMANASVTRDRLLSELAQTMGLWIFYEEGCSFCRAQLKPINAFVEEHGFYTTIITKTGAFGGDAHPSIKIVSQSGQFRGIGVEMTPTIVLAVPPETHLVVSQGFVSKAALEQRVISAAHRYGIIEDEDFYEVEPTSRGLLTTADDAADSGIDWSNQAEWVPYLRKRLKESYGLEEDSYE